MPYDPRMLQMAQQGVRMMGPPQGSQFSNAPQQPKQWWDQPMPGPPPQMGQPADPSKPNDPNDPNDPNAPKQPPQPSLLQMLMLGGKPTYSGTPQQGGASPWGWLGGLGQPPGGGGYK
jgi:hypothetical protein